MMDNACNVRDKFSKMILLPLLFTIYLILIIKAITTAIVRKENFRAKRLKRDKASLDRWYSEKFCTRDKINC